MDVQITCPNCEQNILEDYFFCPNCGKKLKDKPLSVSIGRQILIYLFSFFLPSLGLWPAVKYLKQKDQKSKMIGLVAITLTIVATIITVWFSLDIVNEFNKQLNGNLNLYLY
jgi:hypothetical protein